ncbi:hypothetical protein AB0M05_26040 [Streptomyces violaceusniger]|uniref:hypothetical protein n=1 Tax=Streptomyces violaceusniger TaxID=68280 RepID=UPI0034188401
MDILDRLIELQTEADAERAKPTRLDGAEHAAQWQCWFTAAEASQTASPSTSRKPGSARHPDDG